MSNHGSNTTQTKLAKSLIYIYIEFAIMSGINRKQWTHTMFDMKQLFSKFAGWNSAPKNLPCIPSGNMTIFKKIVYETWYLRYDYIIVRYNLDKCHSLQVMHMIVFG